MGWLTVFPFELNAASLTLQFWNVNVSHAVFITIFWLAVVCINLMGVRGYGEAEFLFSLIKVTAVIGFIILGIVIDVGGSPNGFYYGTKFWHDPGSFNHGFKGVCSVFVTAAFAFAGTELAGLAAAETVLSSVAQSLTSGQSEENSSSCHQASHLASHYILHRFIDDHRMPRSFY